MSQPTLSRHDPDLDRGDLDVLRAAGLIAEIGIFQLRTNGGGSTGRIDVSRADAARVLATNRTRRADRAAHAQVEVGLDDHVRTTLVLMDALLGQLDLDLVLVLDVDPETDVHRDGNLKTRNFLFDELTRPFVDLDFAGVC